jgi:SipL, SPOCS domain
MRSEIIMACNTNQCYRSQYTQRGKCQPKKPECKRLIQTPVVIGWGEKQELVIADLLISPPSPSVFRIIGVDEFVVITSTKLIPICSKKGEHSAKVIVDGYIDKNINYKTITDFTAADINGPVYHFTTRIPFSTFVEVKTCEPVSDYSDAYGANCNKCHHREHYDVEILDAFVEGTSDELLDPNPVAAGAPEWAVTYNRILERVLVRVELKITKDSHLSI